MCQNWLEFSNLYITMSCHRNAFHIMGLYEEKSLVNSGFPAQRVSNVELWCFLWCQLEQPVEKKQSNYQGFEMLWNSCKVSGICQSIHALIYQFNTLRSRKNGHHFADDIFNCIFLNENVWISIKISLKFVPKGEINNIPASVQIMAWRRPGDKTLSEPIMVRLLTHSCITQPQWVNRPGDV